jgi:hypothetical protein
MNRQSLIYTGIAAALGLATALTASTAFAGNGVGGLVNPPPPLHMQVKDVTLAIQSPNGCGAAKMAVFFRANKKGPITFLLVRDTGTVSGPYTVQTKEYGNEYRASWVKNFNLATSISTKYRAVVTHSGKPGSRWVPMKAKC